MATLAESLISSSSRAVRLRMRPDLTARRQRYHGRVYWVVKEPIGLNYFRFHEEEYAILQMLDGQSSLEHIKDRFEQEFTPQKITLQDLQQYIGMLHRSGLVVSEASGQGRQLKRRRDEKKQRELMGKLSNVFALRWRGIDPEKLLNWLYPYTGWFFRTPAIVFNMLLALSALLLVTVQFDEFRTRLPAFHEFFVGWENWLFLAVVMGAVKVLHEFGHGLSCKHFGGECHEMGFMMLVFTPALYCNVSDSWMLPNKWHRVFIGAAGMYVEVVLASIATFIWWYSVPGMINHLALSVMFICSVSTLLFNGNPLLRFDGYYILMDILEIPNLRQKSTQVFQRFMMETCLGIEQPENPFLPQENKFFFGLYTVAAVIYRWIVVISICWFLNKVLEPVGLKPLGQMVAAAGLFGLVAQPLIQLWKLITTPGRLRKVKPIRVAATLGVVAAAVVFVLFVPLPFHVSCSLEVSARKAVSVYAEVPGRLEEQLVRPGDTVTNGQALARLVNLDLQLSVIELEGREAELNVRLANLLRQRFDDERAARQVPELQEELKMVQEQLEDKRLQYDRLVIRAKSDGTVMPPPDRPGESADEGRLALWSGTPLDRKNEGAYLGPSDLICQVGDPSSLEAVLVVDQSDIDLLQLKNGEWPKVDIKLESYPNLTFHSRIEQVAVSPLRASPRSLSTQAGGTLDSVTDKSGQMRPLNTSFQARAPLDDPDHILRLGLRGKAKVYTGWQPLGRRFYRFLTKTFHFDL
jgi:putative peptide zinc metalloprotease protein